MFRRLPQFFLLALVMLSLACSRAAPTANIQPPTAQLPPAQTPAPTATPAFPNLQAELLDKRDKDTTSALGKFDFKNYTYSLPHGWQNPDGTDEITLTNGKVTPYAGTVSEDMSDEDKAAAKAQMSCARGIRRFAWWREHRLGRALPRRSTSGPST